jgi:kynurenine formamidase/class 3 adenylate cyclase
MAKRRNNRTKKAWIDANILFVDIVGFSKKREEIQIKLFSDLFKRVKLKLNKYLDEDYILKSTGDGVLLICFNQDINVLDIAIDIQKSLKVHDVFVRQGINCGRISPQEEINDAIGDCINMCQRIMDCGDENHILLSDHYVETKIGKRTPREKCIKLGAVTVKHKQEIVVFNYFDDSIGNGNIPQNINLFLPELKTFCSKGTWSDLLTCSDIVDLTHEIRNEPPCTFATQDNSAIDTNFSIGQSMGVEFVTTILHNLSLNHGTHIDFPGHIKHASKKVGLYDLNKFVSEVVIFDARKKVENISKFFNKENGNMLIDYKNNSEYFNEFLENLESLEITKGEFIESTKENNLKNKAVLICSDLDKCWQYRPLDAWNYKYFFNPYISKDLAEYFVDNKVNLVGIDALQIENPIINFDGQEENIYFPEWKEKYVPIIEEKLKLVKKYFIHKILLSNEIMILENLKDISKIIDRKSLLVSVPLKLMCSNCEDNSITRAFALSLFNRKE